MRGVVWFRTDLRIDDNPALRNALDNCEEVIGIYIFSQLQWKTHNESNVKLEFLRENLTFLEKSLSKLNIPLITINTDSFDSLPKDLCSFVVSNKVGQIFWNNEFGVNESKRDLLSCRMLEKENVKTLRFDDQVIYEPGYLKTGQGKPFSVFTPFKRRWIENFEMDFLDINYKHSVKKPINIKSDLSKIEFVRTHSVNMDLWPAGESAAQERLSNFLSLKAESYSESRNSPILDGTSRISPYFALGILSPRRCILEGLKLNNYEFTSGNKGICKWIDEIVWREFYRNIMHCFPRVSKNRPFQIHTENLEWRYQKKSCKLSIQVILASQ